MSNFFGYNFPFLGETFVLQYQTDERLIKNDLKQLLLTSFEERVMRPNFGTSIRKTLFEPDDLNSKLLLKDSIRIAIERFEPRVIFRDVKFNSDGQGQLEVIVFASLVNDPNKILSIVVELGSSRIFGDSPAITLPTQQVAT